MKYILTKEQVESLFNYDKYEPGVALMNFYNLLVNKMINENYDKPQIDATKIKISKKLHKDIMDKIKEDAKKSGYPKTPTEESPHSINQGLYQWLNSGPSVDDRLGKYEVDILKGGIIPEEEILKQEV